MAAANQFTSEIKNKHNNFGKLLTIKTCIKILLIRIAKLSEISKILLEQLKKEGIKIDAHIKLF